MLHPMTTTGLAPVLLLLVLNLRITKGIRELQERSALLKNGVRNSSPPMHKRGDDTELVIATTQVDNEEIQKASRLSALTAKRQNR